MRGRRQGEKAPLGWLNTVLSGSRKARAKWALVAVGLSLALLGWLFTLKGVQRTDILSPAEGSASPSPHTLNRPPSSGRAAPHAPSQFGGIPPQTGYMAHPTEAFRVQRTARLKKGDTLFEMLRGLGIPPKEIHELTRACRTIRDIGRLRQGTKILVEYDERDGSIIRLKLDLDEESFLEAVREDGTFRVWKRRLPFRVEHRAVEGTIEDSLFLAGEKAGLPPALILNLSEIFAWDVDFNVDIRMDDRFRLLFEEKRLDGRPAVFGRILAAEIQNQGRTLRAFYFRQSDGREDYFDERGRSLRKVFLRSPLKYTRISSRYSRRRLHPILKIYRPHLGIDYAAPIGTPVRAVGDGRVTFAGWKNGYGRFVKIRHNATYTTTYGHLSRFGRGIRKGKMVKQGQIIGYVGATGLATGPHLDFRMLRNGRFVDPLRINFPSASPVRRQEMGAFREMVRALLSELRGAGAPLASSISGTN